MSKNLTATEFIEKKLQKEFKRVSRHILLMLIGSSLLRIRRHILHLMPGDLPDRSITIRTALGLGISKEDRDSLIVGMSGYFEENGRGLDRAEKALDIIEDALADLSRKSSGPVQIGELAFNYLKHVSHDLSAAEKDWLSKMEGDDTKNAHDSAEDKIKSRRLLKSVKSEFAKRPERPIFEIKSSLTRH